MRLLSISTDRKIFEKDSAVARRQVEYAKKYEEVHIIVFAGRELRETALSANCFVYSTRSWSKFLYFLDAIRLGRFVIQGRGITHITCQDPSFTAMTGISLKKQFGLPLEMQVHGDIGSPFFAHSWANKIRKAMALSYLSKADKVRVVSERLKKYLVGTVGLHESVIEVRPIVVDIEAIKNTPVTVDLHKKYPQFDKIVLMASRLTAEKNIIMAIRAWKNVGQKTGLIIVGSGPLERRLKNEVTRLGLSESVIFESWVEPSVLHSYYKTADIFLNTSLFEGYGMTLVEAHAAGCMIISTDVGVAQEVGATIIPFKDPQALSRIILKNI